MEPLNSKLQLLRNHFWFQHSLLVLICIACYASLEGDFVFDDSVAIVRNQDVTNASTPLTNIFRHDFWGHNLTDPTSHKSFRPLTTLTFQWEVRLFGLQAAPMKFHNLILHIVVCWLLLSVLPRIFCHTDPAMLFLATALFAVHPVHTEAVAGVVGRAELLCSVFYLAALLLFLRMENKSTMSKWEQLAGYTGVWLLSALALLSKEGGITVIPMCLSFVLIRIFHSFSDSNILNRLSHTFLYIFTPKFLMLIASSMLLLYIRLSVMNFESPQFKDMDNPVSASTDLTTKILSQCLLYTINVWILICPDWLSFDWALGSVELIHSISDVRNIPVGCVLLGLIALFVMGSKNVRMALALLVVPFLPASGILKLGFVVAERVLYIPSIGFCVLVALGLDSLCNTCRRNKDKFVYAFGVLLVLLAVRCRLRAHEWSNEETLFRSALRVCPNNAKVHYNIAKLLADKGDRTNAAVYYHQAISLYPEYEAAHMNLGNLYREEHKLDLAESYLRKSIDILEEFPTAWMNLGIVLASRGKYDEALLSYRNALKYRKNYATCYYNIGNLYIEVNNKTMALKYWQDAVAINPRHTKAWANILAMLDNTGRPEEVLQMSAVALRYAPDEPSLMFSQANALGKMSRFEEAEQAYLSIIKKRPNNALYYVNLGVLYHRWGKRKEAAVSYRNALAIDPGHRSAQENLSKLSAKVR